MWLIPWDIVVFLRDNMSYPFCAFAVVNQPVVDPGEAGVSPSLFLDETEVRRAKKIIFGDHSNLSKGMDDRPHPPYLKVWIRLCQRYTCNLSCSQQGETPLNTLGTGHYSSPEAGGAMKAATSLKWSPLITFDDFRYLPSHVFIFQANLSGRRSESFQHFQLRLIPPFFSQKSSDPP